MLLSLYSRDKTVVIAITMRFSIHLILKEISLKGDNNNGRSYGLTVIRRSLSSLEFGTETALYLVSLRSTNLAVRW